MKNLKGILLAAAAPVPFICFAHPGHGNDGGYTITHYFTQPVHIIISAAAFAGIVLLVRHWRKNSQHN